MMHRREFLGAVALPASAAGLPDSAPEQVGLSTNRLRRVHALLQRYIERGDISGSVSVVARKGHIAHLETQGWSDIATKRPMRTESIFRLASMTKAITTVAAMMLHEEGRFLLRDPISRYLPEFLHPKVAIAEAGGAYHVVPAKREIQIRDLLTHTAGLANGTDGPMLEQGKEVYRLRRADTLLADFIRKMASYPLNFQPGTAWQYGPATDVVGRLVEVLSGQTLAELFEQRIFSPLGMKDTFFYLPAKLVPRLVTPYEKTNGQLRALPQTDHANPNGRFYPGAGGLAGTAMDYLRFCQMLLNGGQLDGHRLLSPTTIELMTANHIGTLAFAAGYRFGLGFRVCTDVGEAAVNESPGAYAWGGAYGTYFRIDPKQQLILLLMIQLYPMNLPIKMEFQNVVMQAITG